MELIDSQIALKMQITEIRELLGTLLETCVLGILIIPALLWLANYTMYKVRTQQT